MNNAEQSRKYVKLAEALSWVAFRALFDAAAIKARLQHDPASWATLNNAARQFSVAASDGRLKARGRYVSDFHDCDQAMLANTEDMHENHFKDFQQFDLDCEGLRRRREKDSRVLSTWAIATVARSPDGTFRLTKGWRGSADESNARAFESFVDTSSGGEAKLADGYREVEVLLSDLSRQFPLGQTASTAANGPPLLGRKRSLDYEDIRAQAKELRRKQPEISIASAAASIVADLPANPKTGKPRDTRGIERIISPIWPHREDK